MSDNVSIKDVLSNTTPRESMDPQPSLWMAHWMQTSQNPLSQVHQHQTIHDEKREEDHDTEQGSKPLQIVKSRKAKRVDSDVSVGDISECNNKWKHRQGDFDIPSDVLQLAKGVPDTRKFEIRNNSLMNSKDFVSPGLNSTQLDLLSIGKLWRSSVHHEDFNASSFPYFRNESSEWRTFQKSGFNKKMEDMLSPSTYFSLCDRFRPQLDNKSKYGAADTEGVPGGLTKFSNTTHHLFVTKKADMNLSKGDQMTTESTVSAELKGNSFHKMLALHPGFCRYSEQEPNFRHVVKLADSEEKEDMNTAMTGLQNESTAETDSMPNDFHQSKNIPCGITSSLLHEDLLVGKGKEKSPVAAVSQSKEIGMRKDTAELPGMRGEELRVDLVADRCVDSRERSTSRTESLDVEHLLSHVEHPENSNSSQPCNPLYPEPSSRWVKRLRLSASDSHAFGTKCLKMGDVSSSDKVNKLLNRITSYGRTNSEPASHVCRGKGLKQFDKTSIVLRNMDSSGGLVKDRSDLSLSHSWIRRWCRNRETTTQARPAPQVACEPEDSKFSLEEIQKKQFPSIAAMALMGKAVTSFRPCEFRKKGGSLVVWNTDVVRLGLGGLEAQILFSMRPPLAVLAWKLKSYIVREDYLNAVTKEVIQQIFNNRCPVDPLLWSYEKDFITGLKGKICETGDKGETLE
ncbi:hypothetical protein MRB53_030963 [Persea americana]|uniref:Uncharacterized protein n=1 Tax=Persea americana TaxID=3435 RepID=A0ACC2KMP9_PERAE|nr:hypothetical protein MRB53_030963 [Persea americana]